MLKIWYYANIDYMKDAPSYFDNVYEDEWIEDPFVKNEVCSCKITEFSAMYTSKK